MLNSRQIDLMQSAIEMGCYYRNIRGRFDWSIYNKGDDGDNLFWEVSISPYHNANVIKYLVKCNLSIHQKKKVFSKKTTCFLGNVSCNTLDSDQFSMDGYFEGDYRIYVVSWRKERDEMIDVHSFFYQIH